MDDMRDKIQKAERCEIQEHLPLVDTTKSLDRFERSWSILWQKWARMKEVCKECKDGGDQPQVLKRTRSTVRGAVV